MAFFLKERKKRLLRKKAGSRIWISDEKNRLFEWKPAIVLLQKAGFWMSGKR